MVLWASYCLKLVDVACFLFILCVGVMNFIKKSIENVSDSWLGDPPCCQYCYQICSIYAQLYVARYCEGQLDSTKICSHPYVRT